MFLIKPCLATSFSCITIWCYKPRLAWISRVSYNQRSLSLSWKNQKKVATYLKSNCYDLQLTYCFLSVVAGHLDSRPGHRGKHLHILRRWNESAFYGHKTKKKYWILIQIFHSDIYSQSSHWGCETLFYCKKGARFVWEQLCLYASRQRSLRLQGSRFHWKM